MSLVLVIARLDNYSDKTWAHVARHGIRFAALQPSYDVVIDCFVALSKCRVQNQARP
jgi:hypothetical protein